jgi:TPR repeat protein
MAGRLRRDPVEALRWLDHALEADTSCARALVIRGEMARLGLGCERDLKLAIAMLRKSMALGNVEGKYRLGHCLIASSVGLPTLDEGREKCRLGKRLVEEALDEGEGHAGIVLGHWYEYPDTLRDVGI